MVLIRITIMKQSEIALQTHSAYVWWSQPGKRPWFYPPWNVRFEGLQGILSSVNLTEKQGLASLTVITSKILCNNLFGLSVLTPSRLLVTDVSHSPKVAMAEGTLGVSLTQHIPRVWMSRLKNAERDVFPDKISLFCVLSVCVGLRALSY